jgi:hypothetical protein
VQRLLALNAATWHNWLINADQNVNGREFDHLTAWRVLINVATQTNVRKVAACRWLRHGREPTRQLTAFPGARRQITRYIPAAHRAPRR